MRCPNCNKFVPYGEQDPELELEVQDQPKEGDDEPTVTVAGTVRIVLTCEKCGEELKEANLDVLVEDIKVPAKPPAGTEWAEDSEWELDGESAENEQRTEGGGRYMKTFYGASVSGHVTRTYTGPTVIGKFDKAAIPFEWSDYIQASSMDEMV